jgi:hypothetical protein
VVNHQQKVVRDGAIGVRCIAFKTVRQLVPFVICVVGFCRWSLHYACMYSCTHYNIPVFISFHIACYLLATRFPAQRTLFLFSQLDNPMGSQIGMNVLPTWPRMHARINISIFSCSFAFYSLIDSYMHTCTHAHCSLFLSYHPKISWPMCPTPFNQECNCCTWTCRTRCPSTTLLWYDSCYCIAVVFFCGFSVSQNVHRAIYFIVSFLFFISLFSHTFHCFACSHFFVGSIATKPSCRHTDPRCCVVPATSGSEGGQQPCVNRPRFVGVGKRMSLVVWIESHRVVRALCLYDDGSARCAPSSKHEHTRLDHVGCFVFTRM